MSKRRKGKRRAAEVAPPELRGVALLLSEMPAEVLDLHGMKVAAAERRLQFFLERHASVSAGRVVHVVTGKGTGSDGRAVLFEMARDLLNDELGASVAEVAGLPGGGGFAARIRSG